MRSLPKAEILRCFFDESVEPHLSAMLLRWDAMRPGQTVPIACPIPRWDGCERVPSTALPTAMTGDGVGPGR